MTISCALGESPDFINKSPLLKWPEKRLISFLCEWRDVFSSSFSLRPIYDSYYGEESAHEY